MTGLALEGGGAKGSYQAGAYMALKKYGVKINAVAGTSIGAFNGALIASHDEDKMIEMWKDATTNELLGIDDTKASEILHSGFSIDTVKNSFHELYKILKNKGIDISNYRALIRNSVDEEKLRESNIKFGLTTIKLEDLKPLELFLDDIPKGQLQDYIVASSYLPIFKKEKLADGEYFLDGGFYNLSPVDMLDKIGCDKIYVVNIKGIGFRKPNKNLKAQVIEIKPTDNLGSIILFDKKSVEDNMTRGFKDTMKVLGKLDGIDYYFSRKSNWYYKRLNHKVDEHLYKAASALLNSHDEKETVIKGMEYLLKKEEKNDLITYKQSAIIELSKKKDDHNIIIRYLNKLSIW